MIISTQTHELSRRFGLEKTLEIIKGAGFDAADVSMFDIVSQKDIFGCDDWKANAEKIKRKASDLGLTLNQAHAPFPSYKFGDEDYNKKEFDFIVKAIKVCGILGIPKIVVHPIATPKNVEQMQFNLDFYNKFIPYLDKAGVKICIENMWGHDQKRGYIVPNVCSFGKDLAQYADALGDRYFTVCLDVGHSGLVGENVYDAIKALGNKRLTALHIHDNDYRNDSHVIPFDGKIDWDGFVKGLAEIDYKGEFTFEADNCYSNLPEEFMPERCAYMYKVGKYLADKIDALRG